MWICIATCHDHTSMALRYGTRSHSLMVFSYSSSGSNQYQDRGPNLANAPFCTLLEIECHMN